MRNRGQSLVLFILLIPLILLILSFIIELGNLNYNKKNIDNKIEMIIENGFNENLNQNEIYELIINNIKDVIINDVSVYDNSIEITLKTYFKPLIIDKNIYNYQRTYIGKKIENKIKIVRK